ncbi:WD40/YVTN/BNR-like repeat-containing protein [Natronosalvus caseinilyticus]|uniref:WD40/YVTN/BNR-like repeat-containing protein n=1 Tax=Natronosalvus caseinilyticus TaxID=2953747 RepID=UPI0028AE9931|nr:hypothetical protein [Natronosalvus caseinilyticus]
MTTIYTALPNRLLVSRDDTGATGDDESEDDGDGEWSQSTRLEGYDLECVAASPDAPDRVFVGTFEDGLFRSTDGGETFDALETDFASDAVMAATVSPHDPDVVYVGTEPSRVYRSEDGGDSWTHVEGLVDLPSEEEWYFPPRPHTHHVRWLEVDPHDPDRLYVGIEAGAFVIRDEAQDSWQERPEGSRFDNHSLATHPDMEGRVYSAAGDGYAQSDDGGETWSHPQMGLEHRYCWSVVPHPDDPDRVLISSASGASSAHTASRAKAYAYRKPGRDADWERLDDRGLPMGEGIVRTIFDESEGTVYAVNNLGCFVSRDFGDSWSVLEADWEGPESKTPRGLAVVA